MTTKWMKLIASSLIVLLWFPHRCITTAVEVGAHSEVQHLTDDNFDEALSDPANGLWLLKFYAPWCGHCKKLAPVLDEVAPLVKGKLAIGKVDCTKYKTTCNRFEVKSYPTLKFYRDGDYHDYSFERSKASILAFANKMATQPVTIITSSSDDTMTDQTDDNDNTVSFVAFDPNAHGTTDTAQILASTTFLQIYAQVARMQQPHANFKLLPPDTNQDTLATFHPIPQNGKPDITQPFLVKIEKNIPPIKFNDSESTLTKETMLTFVKQNNIPLLSNLGPHNFRNIGHLGKPLLIAVVDPNDTKNTENILTQLKQVAQHSSSSANDNHYFRSKFNFCYMDGKKWERFLQQFDIPTRNLPQVFVLDVPNRIFWTNENFQSLELEPFLNGVLSGEIPSREQPHSGSKTPFDELKHLFLDYMPYSAIAVIFVFGMFYLMFLPDKEEDEEEKGGGADADAGGEKKETKKEK